MANATIFSSPNVLGKRSSHFDDEEMHGMDEGSSLSSTANHTGKRFKLSSRMVPSASSESLSFGSPASAMDEISHPSKMARRSNENLQNQLAVAPYNHELQELKYQNSQYATRMHQAEITLAAKEAQIQDSRNLNQRLLEELKSRTTERDTMAEENRILKRAVAIQENKIKEMTNQMREYEQFIGAARAYIEEAEREKLLRQQQAAMSSYPRSDFFPPQPPPDVF